jgi:holo-[acyl-carrier protein] synthase
MGDFISFIFSHEGTITLKVTGIGVDIIEVERIRAARQRWGDRFQERIFTQNERKYCDAKMNPALHYAGKFACKEAVSKALKLRWEDGIHWKDIEITNDEHGIPDVVLRKKAREKATHSRVQRVFVSISHQTHNAIAFALTATGE